MHMPLHGSCTARARAPAARGASLARHGAVGVSEALYAPTGRRAAVRRAGSAVPIGAALHAGMSGRVADASGEGQSTVARLQALHAQATGGLADGAEATASGGTLGFARVCLRVADCAAGTVPGVLARDARVGRRVAVRSRRRAVGVQGALSTRMAGGVADRADLGQTCSRRTAGTVRRSQSRYRRRGRSSSGYSCCCPGTGRTLRPVCRSTAWERRTVCQTGTRGKCAWLRCKSPAACRRSLLTPGSGRTHSRRYHRRVSRPDTARSWCILAEVRHPRARGRRLQVLLQRYRLLHCRVSLLRRRRRSRGAAPVRRPGSRRVRSQDSSHRSPWSGLPVQSSRRQCRPFSPRFRTRASARPVRRVRMTSDLCGPSEALILIPHQQIPATQATGSDTRSSGIIGSSRSRRRDATAPPPRATWLVSVMRAPCIPQERARRRDVVLDRAREALSVTRVVETKQERGASTNGTRRSLQLATGTPATNEDCEQCRSARFFRARPKNRAGRRLRTEPRDEGG